MNISHKIYKNDELKQCNWIDIPKQYHYCMKHMTAYCILFNKMYYTYLDNNKIPKLNRHEK